MNSMNCVHCTDETEFMWILFTKANSYLETFRYFYSVGKCTQYQETWSIEHRFWLLVTTGIFIPYFCRLHDYVCVCIWMGQHLLLFKLINKTQINPMAMIFLDFDYKLHNKLSLAKPYTMSLLQWLLLMLWFRQFSTATEREIEIEMENNKT